MREIHPIPVTHKHKRHAFVYKDLNTCSHVFLRNGVKGSLERLYTGPYKVLERISDVIFKIDMKGSPSNVTIERLKPAYFMSEDLVVNEPTARSTNNNDKNNLSPLENRQQSVTHVPTNNNPIILKEPVKLKTYGNKKKVHFKE